MSKIKDFYEFFFGVSSETRKINQTERRINLDQAFNLANELNDYCSKEKFHSNQAILRMFVSGRVDLKSIPKTDNLNEIKSQLSRLLDYNLKAPNELLSSIDTLYEIIRSCSPTKEEIENFHEKTVNEIMTYTKPEYGKATDEGKRTSDKIIQWIKTEKNKLESEGNIRRNIGCIVFSVIFLLACILKWDLIVNKVKYIVNAI